MKNGDVIQCFERGARPAIEVFDAYRCYAYEVFIEGILQGIVARRVKHVLDAYILEEKLLLLDIQKAGGRPETMRIINKILKARFKKNLPTILIGEYVPLPILFDIQSTAIFITDKAEPECCHVTEESEHTNEY